jgi:hypothetical protein
MDVGTGTTDAGIGVDVEAGGAAGVDVEAGAAA